ncbi:TatD family hydrolase [Entomomonas asaccharolytica]|uniref:TatD family hydrolase n=1 Tax=Entomomonas asaccharolytica TaxID=2785331 RepID=A0A974NEY6_9GAMM|nr:TatD family hydrolase [Entomomonas asaccharolytica]QQP85242.1 TatD family hydrolase [Entomomonas asaccharolytica]
MHLIDTHNHLGCEDFNKDRDQVLKRSIELGVIKQIMVGVFTNEWQHTIQLAQQHPSLYVACGIHPMYIPSAQQIPQALDLLKQLFATAENSQKLCALGEIGLDYYIDNYDQDQQQQLFKRQLAIATEYQKPVLLHVRRAHADTIKILKSLKFKLGGIAHAFSGSYEEAKEYIKLGFKIGLGGAGTYPQAHRMHRVLQQLPLEAIVLETDAPDLSPVGQQGQRNSPEFLPEICQQLAKIKGISAELLAEASTQNACQLFNWDYKKIIVTIQQL